MAKKMTKNAVLDRLVELIRANRIRVNAPHGCFLCGVEGCSDKCELWHLTGGP